MQGLEGDYSMILVDGQPIQSGLASVYGLRQFLSESIERIEIVKGSGSAVYGSAAIGGIINVITRQPARGKPSGELSVLRGSYDTYDVSARGSLREGDLALFIGAQKYDTDFVDENGIDGEADNYTDRVERNNYSVNLKMNYYLGRDTHRLYTFGRNLHEFRRGGYLGIRKSLYDGEVRYYRAIDDMMDPDSEHITTDRYEYGAGYTNRLPNESVLGLHVTGTYHERTATNSSMPFSSEERTWFTTGQYSLPVLERHFLTTGFSYRDENLRQEINRDRAPGMDARGFGLFVQDEISLAERLGFVAGARYDDSKSSITEASAISPRGGVRWEAANFLVLRANAGRGFRVPHLFAEELHLCSAAPKTYVDPAIEPEKAWSYSVAGTWYRGNLNLDLNIFRNEIQKKIALLFEDEDIPEGHDAIYKNTDDAVTQGFELSADCQFTMPVAMNLSFAYNDAKYKNSLDPRFVESKNLMRVPETAFRLGVTYEETWYGTYMTAAGRRIGRMYVEKELTVDESKEGEPLSEYSIERTPAYWVLDVRAEKTFWNGMYGFFLGVDNLLDEKQERVYNPEQEETAAYIYAPLTGRYIYSGVTFRL